MRKSECTEEQWIKYREYQRRFAAANKEKIKAQRKAKLASAEAQERESARRMAYYRRPEVTAKRRIIDAQPAAVARRRAYARTAAAKIRAQNRMDERLKANPALRSYRKNAGRLRRTGFSNDLVDRLVVAQGNACAVCRRLFSVENKIHADHCHDTNTPRGLLCFQCNIIEGKLKTIQMAPLEFAQRLHGYLENPPAKLVDVRVS